MLLIALWETWKMCEVTAYFSSCWMTVPSAREPVKTFIICRLTLRCQLRASYCLLYWFDVEFSLNSSVNLKNSYAHFCIFPVYKERNWVII